MMQRTKILLKAFLRMIGCCVVVPLLILIFLEVMLAIFDPWGTSYLRDLRIYQDQIAYDEQGHLKPKPDTYEFSNFTATILEDGTRRVPDTQPGECQIVAIGDSVTFGWGVDDSETFVNLMAKQFPDVQFINAGVVGTNAEQIAFSSTRFPEADGFIYMVTDNDREGPLDIEKHSVWYNHLVAYGWIYYKYYQESQVAPPDNQSQEVLAFWQAIDSMNAMGNVLFTSYYEEVQDWFKEKPYPLYRLDTSFEVISFADAHPDATSHARFAEDLQPAVDELISRVCDTP